MTTEDTIVAIATPQGRGGIGIVRLSGNKAIEIVSGLIRLSKIPLETQHATLGMFSDPASHRTLDRVVVTCFRHPHSYTGEDVVEISCHGSPVILGYLVQCCLEHGARAAEPGEFTLRAFLNSRIDLTQAEAIRDLIESQTLYQARVASSQLEGAVSARLKPHKRALLDLIARLEAGIDFAEDDVPVMGWEDIRDSLENIRSDLQSLVEGYTYGRIVREGLSLAIVGRPNVGKSSLFNRLLGQDRAIVTATPGTTRDLVAESVNIDGIPLRFVDTAGVREALDEAEKIGVQKTYQAVADSDLRLLVVDMSQPWTDEDATLTEKVRPMGPLVVVGNKADLPPAISRAELEQRIMPDGKGGLGIEIVSLSALTGNGIDQLKTKVVNAAAPAHELGGEFITNLRHQQLLKDSVRALARAQCATQEQIPHEMLLLDLYDALRPLDTITGATYADDILGIIFSTFCVGK